MTHIITAANRNRNRDLVYAMFSDRKRIFVDALKWQVPVIDGRYEIDQYDTDDAIYIIEEDGRGRHLASMRFLPSLKPHLLGDLFPFLCDGPLPSGEDVWEAGRGCISPDLSGDEYNLVAARLCIAMQECAILYGVTTLITFTPVHMLSRALAWGWDITPLGLPQDCGGELVGAFVMPVSTGILLGLRKKLGLKSPIVQCYAERAA